MDLLTQCIEVSNLSNWAESFTSIGIAFAIAWVLTVAIKHL